jgi:hypothetical protein
MLFQQREQAARLHQALTRLPEKYRTMIHLRDLLELGLILASLKKGPATHHSGEIGLHGNDDNNHSRDAERRCCHDRESRTGADGCPAVLRGIVARSTRLWDVR